MPSGQFTTREQFMVRIRQALGREGDETPAPPDPPAVDEALVRLASAGDDLVGMFCERAEQVGMNVRRTTMAGLPTVLLDALREIGARKVTLALDAMTNEDLIEEALTRAGIELLDWRNDRTMAPHYEVDAGITDVHAALAETGTLVCCSDALHGRRLSLVPPVHIAVVKKSDILPDLLDYMGTLRGVGPRDLPSAQALITGPSKTADIEGILITGVHGPGKVFVLLVEDG